MLKIKERAEKILDQREITLIKKLKSPIRVQDFLDQLPFNFETEGQTYMSPRRVLREKKAHCFEGALFATLCLSYHGIPNFLLDLKVKKSAIDDSDHIICLFSLNGFWGAISKTNHSVLRWRDPIYRDFKEIAKTYFHEYFLDDGEKTLESFSKPFDIWKNFGSDWVVAEEDLHEVAEKLDNFKHIIFFSSKNKKFIRKVGQTEVEGAMVTEWDKDARMRI